MQQSVFEIMQQMGHEQVVFCHDPHSGLNAIIAIHNTTLGSALGGTRLWNYNSHSDAIIDALRLSRGMTYKAAISGLNLGGGKAVIIADPSMKSEALWRRYGKFVNSLNGKYITAEDVNTSARDMEYISLETDFVTGVPEYMGGSGDPSPFTAYGVFVGMKASAKKMWGNDSLSGKKVLVQGVGHVGQYLVEHLTKEGAKVYISDIN
jgi:leucine dehydrogenase